MSRSTQSLALIEIAGLSAGYHDKILFENLHLRIDPGTLVCFMGPNGAGKSTLIRTLSGIQPPLKGEVNYQGETIASTRMNSIVSLVLTDPVIAPYMTVFDLVTFGRYPYLDWRLKLSEDDHRIIEEAIAQVGISSLRQRRLFELSDGQRQMAMIARAIAQDTPVMILDEPTAHLDLNNRVEIMKLLKELTRRTGKGVLMATHELDLALQTADVIWLAGHQREIITGIPEDLVLSGGFDDIFKFKGFDLKTGRVQHIPYRNQKVSLTGDGHNYLWTKNLLERNGFEVVSESYPTNITRIVISGKEDACWIVNDEKTYSSIAELLPYLLSIQK
jgi:iron complex transport system ATP-binding protein